MKASILASLFSQEASPRAWLLAQNLIGGTPDKRRILKAHCQGKMRVVEVGCSVGNIARALIDEPVVEYLGLDVDEGALTYARRWYQDTPQFNFSTQTLQDVAKSGRKFDLICLTGVLHHVDRPVAEAMFAGAREVAAEGATLLVFDPIPLRPTDGVVYKVIHALEQGEYLRDLEMLVNMARTAGFEISHSEEIAIGPGLTPWPKIMTLGVVEARVP